ncbi:Tyrosine--tRNA ligase, cytoplasmic [Cytospora mali]|uniref:Tyrosine--tRNA ligase n=1 Tax=Cytospora mali TaxID=578113 RepID=A0A194V187_CYTMA|nr:Tyrosine--tRNA ligase, cytoplasmic [Valsa mali var. pyri (nom. inval.)]
MAQMPAEERIALIKENLAEHLDFDIIEKIINEGKDPKVYWGTATTGRPHCGYFVPAIKLAQLLRSGCELTILLADIHGFLDNLKAPIELVEQRAHYYRRAITAMLTSTCGPEDVKKLKFVLGSSYQKSPEYCMDVYKMASVVSEHDAKKAGAEVVKQTANAPLSGLLYPILQVLDEQYLDVDVQFGGVDQRKLFTAAKDWLPKLGYRQRAHIMNPMVPGLQGGKMSSSDANSKIDLLEDAETVVKKIKKAECVPKVPEGNGVLAFVEYVLMPAARLRGQPGFVVDRSRDSLPELVYTTVEQLHDDYRNDVLTPQILKPAVSRALNELMAPIRDEFNGDKEWQELAERAYPPEKKVVKDKKKKDRGTMFPGAKEKKNKSQKEGADKAPADGAVTSQTEDLAIRTAADATES